MRDLDDDRSKYRERHYALNPSRSAPSSLAVSKPDVKTSTPPINTGIAAAVTPITAANKERAIMNMPILMYFNLYQLLIQLDFRLAYKWQLAFLILLLFDFVFWLGLYIYFFA